LDYEVVFMAGLRPRKWRTRGDVRKLAFDISKEGYRTWLGDGLHANVYTGKIHFKGGTSHKVAIKEFKKPLTNSDVEKYEKAIADLRAEGINLPKIGFYFLDGKWVQASQLFGTALNRSYLSKAKPTTFSEKLDASTKLVKVVNAGYFPSTDSMRYSREGKRAFMFDLGIIVGSKMRLPHNQRIGSLAKRICSYCKGLSLEDRKRIIKKALETASPEYREKLAEIIKAIVSASPSIIFKSGLFKQP